MPKPVGRPTLSSTEPTDRIEVKMPASLKRRSTALAELRGLELSTMIRRWLTDQVDDAERVSGASLVAKRP